MESTEQFPMDSKISRGSFLEAKEKPVSFIFPTCKTIANCKSTNPQLTSNAFNYFPILYNFGYYFLIVPFKVNQDGGQLVLTTCTVQKCLCILNHVWGVIECVCRVSLTGLSLVSKHQNSIRHNPSVLFDFATEVSIAFATLTFSYTIWAKRKQVVNFFTALVDISPQRDTGKKMGTRCSMETWTVVLLCIFSLFDPIADQVKQLMITQLSTEKNLWTDSDSNAYMFLRNYASVYISEAEFLKCAFIFFTVILGFFTGLKAFFCTMILSVVYCLVTYKLGTGWTAFLKKAEEEQLLWKNYVQLVENYRRLKVAVENLNKVASFSMLIYLTMGLLFFSNYLIILLESGDLHFIILLSTAIVIFSGSLGLAANGHSMMQKTGSYIFDNMAQFANEKPSELGIFLHEIDQHPLGLEAHSFSITYSLIMKVVSTVLTYFFIMIQFNVKYSPKTSN